MASTPIVLVELVLMASCLPLVHLSPPLLGLEDEAVISAAHLEHLQRLTWFHCNTPQPRVISVTELFEASEVHDRAFFPDTTVLHRCDYGSGCCMLGGSCGPVRQQTARLPFKVTYLQDIGPHKRGSWNMEFHHFINHTECGCVTQEHTRNIGPWTSQ